MSDKTLPPPAQQTLLDPRVQDDPFAFYAHLHATCPVHRIAPEGAFPGAYIIAGYDDLRSALTDVSSFTNKIGSRKQAMQGAGTDTHEKVLAEKGWPQAQTLQRCDPPDHLRHRKLVDRIFTPRRVQELAPQVERVTHELLDSFIDRGECDYVSEFAAKLPAIIVAGQLGLDTSQIGMFRRWVEAILAPGVRLLSEDETREVATIEAESQHYLVNLFEARRREPRDDMISRLVNSEQEGEPLTTAEMINLVDQLIVGGLETTTGAIAHGLWFLIRYPEQMKKLRADRSLMPNFIEEVLRFDSPVQALPRRAAKDVEMHGVTIPAGSYVHMRYGAANRDPAKFDRPEIFDITRENAKEHIAFGLGGHYCVGAFLARREMHIAFTATLDRMEDIALARPLPVPAHHPNILLRPLKELPIRFRKVGG
jgi:cytochrome P450